MASFGNPTYFLLGRFLIFDLESKTNLFSYIFSIDEYFVNTSPSESEDDEELLEELTLDDEDESEDSDEVSDEELLEVEEELELLSLFLAAGFFPLPLCSCSSCLASSLCSI